FHIWHIYVGCYLALGLGLGARTFALSDDDHRSVRDTGRVFAHRLKKSLRSQEPHLVHCVVERGSWSDHGNPVPLRSCRARSFSRRCACAHSRCDYSCSVDASVCESLSLGSDNLVSTRFDKYRQPTLVGPIYFALSLIRQSKISTIAWWW